MKRFYTYIVFFSIIVFAHAQSFKASAPEQVEEGENFRVQFVVTDSEPSSFKGPKFDSEGFELLAGPYTSTYSSYQMVNGKTTSSSSTTYTYTLCASKKGTYTVPAATVSAGGKTLTSNTLTIKVVAGSGNNTAGASGRITGRGRRREYGRAVFLHRSAPVFPQTRTAQASADTVCRSRGSGSFRRA